MTSLLKFIKENKLSVFVFVLLFAALALLSLGSNEAESSEGTTLYEYELRLEKELSELCSSIDGVGKCRVKITFETGEENLYRGSALIETKPPRVLGVSVVCQGGERASVRQELTELFSSLFGIGTNRIKISKLK